MVEDGLVQEEAGGEAVELQGEAEPQELGARLHLAQLGPEGSEPGQEQRDGLRVCRSPRVAQRGCERDRVQLGHRAQQRRRLRRLQHGAQHRQRLLGVRIGPGQVRRLEQQELARTDVALGDEAAPANAVVFDQPDRPRVQGRRVGPEAHAAGALCGAVGRRRWLRHINAFEERHRRRGSGVCSGVRGRRVRELGRWRVGRRFAEAVPAVVH